MYVCVCARGFVGLVCLFVFFYAMSIECTQSAPFLETQRFLCFSHY